jgi:hypothetical protein
MSFPPNIAEKALLDCGRCCCICHKFCGFKIELHHIIQKSEGGEDSYENCIPLCLDCHAEVKAYNPKHPKGRKYNESELMGHKNRWYEKVQSKSFSLVHPECIDLDRKLFLKLKEILPATGGAISFIRDHDYGEPWLSGIHEDLNYYRLKYKDPEFEFIDIDLEMHRCQLTESVDKFLKILYTVSFPIELKEDSDFYMAIYPEIKYSKRDVYDEAIKNVHGAANEVCDAYDALIRLSRRKLAI